MAVQPSIRRVGDFRSHYRREMDRAQYSTGLLQTTHAFRLLHFAFVLLPLIAGLDKYFHVLANWNLYLAPAFPRLINVTREQFMAGVGVIEITAAVMVAFKPSVGGIVVAAWLWVIILNLLMIPGYYDIILRDFGLSLAALALSRLALAFEK